MIETAQGALSAWGIDDQLVAVGQFYPRGHTGGGFAGGLIGGDVGGGIGGLAEGIGLAAGYSAGTRAHDAGTGLPENMLVGASAGTVYGLAVSHRNSEPSGLVFRVPRDGLEVKVHQRVNVRVLELIESESGSRIELEGNRLPVTHSKDVIDELR
jgi:hypothetical protein